MIHPLPGTGRPLLSALTCCIAIACTQAPSTQITSTSDLCAQEIESFIADRSPGEIYIPNVCSGVERSCSIYFGSSVADVSAEKVYTECLGVTSRVGDGQQGLVVFRNNECPTIIITNSRIRNTQLDPGPFCIESPHAILVRATKPEATGIVLKEGFPP